MKLSIIVVISLSLVLVTACTPSQRGEDNTQDVVQEKSKKATKELSEIILELNDFPKGWRIDDRSERVRSDVSEQGLSLGWQKGYYISFSKGENIFDPEAALIEQYISVYPTENMDKIMQFTSDETTTYEELTDPKIGDKSKAFKVTEKDEYGETITYLIAFNKGNVHQNLFIGGHTLDYELLKKLAKKAAKNIE